MNILWVEDFGGVSSPSFMAYNLFKELISEKLFDEEYDSRIDVAIELPRLFKEYSLHDIVICKSYTEWKQQYTHTRDFDIAILDISLENSPTPHEEKPEKMKGNSHFDSFAGFYIYYQLIKGGFPDDNIAIFTGFQNSLDFFSKHCSEILIDAPQYTYEKTKEKTWELSSNWLHEKIYFNSYLILRRGIIEGCHFLKEKLYQSEPSDLDKQLLFYKTTAIDINEYPELYRIQVIDYLTNLERFLTLSRPEDKNYAYSSFIKELAAYWENSSGVFNLEKSSPATTSKVEDNFCRTSQTLMKLLRNWSFQNLLSPFFSEQDVAYFFMLAIRSLCHLDFTIQYKHEQILSALFSPLTEEETEDKMSSGLEHLLSISYKALEQEMKVKPDFNAQANYFLALLHTYGQQPREHTGNLAEIIRREIRSHSMQLLYQAYWHGLFPAYLQTGYGNALEVHFDIEALPFNSFPYFLGRCIFRNSFESLSITSMKSARI